MRKLHKKYIVLNVFLIIYIMSLSVGYAYFSESIQATGTAKTLAYSNMPLSIRFNTTSDSYAAVSGYHDYIEYTKTLHPSYDVYEIYHTVDYTMLLDDDSLFPGDIIGQFAFSFYVSKTIDVPITNYAVSVQDLTNMVYKVYDIKPKIHYNLEQWQNGTGDDLIYIQHSLNGDFGGLSPNPKKILINVSFTSQGKDRNLKVYFIFNLV